jgi:hypothetical protein
MHRNSNIKFSSQNYYYVLHPSVRPISKFRWGEKAGHNTRLLSRHRKHPVTEHTALFVAEVSSSKGRRFSQSHTAVQKMVSKCVQHVGVKLYLRKTIDPTILSVFTAHHTPTIALCKGTSTLTHHLVRSNNCYSESIVSIKIKS